MQMGEAGIEKLSLASSHQRTADSSQHQPDYKWPIETLEVASGPQGVF